MHVVLETRPYDVLMRCPNNALMLTDRNVRRGRSSAPCTLATHQRDVRVEGHRREGRRFAAGWKVARRRDVDACAHRCPAAAQYRSSLRNHALSVGIRSLAERSSNSAGPKGVRVRARGECRAAGGVHTDESSTGADFAATMRGTSHGTRCRAAQSAPIPTRRVPGRDLQTRRPGGSSVTG